MKSNDTEEKYSLSSKPKDGDVPPKVDPRHAGAREAGQADQDALSTERQIPSHDIAKSEKDLDQYGQVSVVAEKIRLFES